MQLYSIYFANQGKKSKKQNLSGWAIFGFLEGLIVNGEIACNRLGFD
jgi:hypothetical protein